MRASRMNEENGVLWRIATGQGKVLVILAAGLAMAGIGLVVTSANKATGGSKGPAPGAFQRMGQTGGGRRVIRARLKPDVRNILNAVGDRYERAGKERLVLMGTIVRPGEDGSQPHPVRIISELGGGLRVEEQLGTGVQVTVFNRGNVMKRSGAVTRQDQELVEMLVFDSLDRFVDAQANGMAIRWIGSRFRLDEGAEEDYSGPVYELYQLMDEVRIGEKAKSQPKFLYFNTNTLLLERIRYQVSGSDSEVEMGNWGDVEGQKVPGSIVRRENGKATMTVTISSAGFAAKANDGIFDRP